MASTEGNRVAASPSGGGPLGAGFRGVQGEESRRALSQEPPGTASQRQETQTCHLPRAGEMSMVTAGCQSLCLHLARSSLWLKGLLRGLWGDVCTVSTGRRLTGPCRTPPGSAGSVVWVPACECSHP